MLRGVLVDVHLVHLRGLAQLGQLGLWDVGEALRLERLQVGQVLACRWRKYISGNSQVNKQPPGSACIGLGQMFLWQGAIGSCCLRPKVPLFAKLGDPFAKLVACDE